MILKDVIYKKLKMWPRQDEIHIYDETNEEIFSRMYDANYLKKHIIDDLKNDDEIKSLMKSKVNEVSAITDPKTKKIGIKIFLVKKRAS